MLEEKIAALTEALNENNELLRTLTGKAKAGLADAGVTKGDKEPAAKQEEEKPTRRRAAAAKAPKAPTLKQITDETTAYLDVDDDEEYNNRADIVVSITEHFGVKKMSEIEEGDRAQAMEMLAAAKAGDDPFDGIEPKEDAKPARRSLA